MEGRRRNAEPALSNAGPALRRRPCGVSDKADWASDW